MSIKPAPRSLRIVILSLLLVCLFFAGTRLTLHIASAQQTDPAATLEPTSAMMLEATTTTITTATTAPQTIVLPTIDWKDVSANKKAMKPGFEKDVDSFVDANRYLIVAQLTIDTPKPDRKEGNAVIRGAERVRFTNHSTESLKTLEFRLYPNTEVLAGEMDVTHVMINDRTVDATYKQANSVMTVPLSAPLASNASVELTIDFTVVMRPEFDAAYGRYGYVHHVVSATAWYPTLSVYQTGKGWWEDVPSPEGDPAFTETGLYDVRLTLPKDFVVAMSGTIIDKTTNADGTITYRDVTGPMRDHAFQASARYAINTVDVDGVHVNIVYYKDAPNAGKGGTASAAKYATQAVATYDKTYGDYPFAELDITQNPTPSGVEYPGLVQIAEENWQDNDQYLEVIIAHEVAHQWFYSLIGNDQVEHPWLDESLASYAEFVYVRAVYANSKSPDNYVNNFQQRYNAYLLMGGSDQPLDLPVDAYSGQGYGAIVYTKGPLFLVALERDLGRTVVYKMMHDYFADFKYKVATSAGMEKSFERSTGKDLTAQFKKWVYGAKAAPENSSGSM